MNTLLFINIDLFSFLVILLLIWVIVFFISRPVISLIKKSLPKGKVNSYAAISGLFAIALVAILIALVFINSGYGE